MPIYDYKCNDCEEIFEVTCKIAEIEDPKTCPKCQSQNCVRSYQGQYNMAIPADRLGRMKTPDGFKDVLNSIADRTPGGRQMKDRIR